MKKTLILISLILLSVGFSFAFDIMDSKSEQRKYFSLNDNLVKVINNDNLSDVLIKFDIDNITKNQTYSLSACDDGYCASFILRNLIEDNGGSLVNSTTFEIIIENSTKIIYLDTRAPQIEIETEISQSKKQIEFNASYFDDLVVEKAQFFYKDSSNNLILISDIENNKTLTYLVNKTGAYDFVFKVHDKAGNIKEISKRINIDDMFVPVIKSTFLTLKDFNLQFTFEVADDNLYSYELIQNALTLSEKINGTSFKKTVNVPFESGSFIFKVTDSFSNSINKTISINSPIKNTYKNKYSNEKTFIFNSNAQVCVLTGVDFKSYNENFKKSSNIFSIELDIGNVKEYIVSFYCEKDNFREHYKKEFYYDINKPSLPQIDVKANDKGTIDITWSKSEDNESSVSYILYKNSKEVYKGTKLSFEDVDVKYSNNYSYYVKAIDEAQNSITTDEVFAVPKKVKVDFTTDLKDNIIVNSTDFIFNINTDPNSKINVILKKDNYIIQSLNFESTDVDIDVKLNLKEGLNNILIKIEDKYSNKIEKSYFVNYEILSEIKIDEQAQLEFSKISEQEKNQAVENNNSLVSSSQEIANEAKGGFLKWFLIVIFIFVIIILVLYINHQANFQNNGRRRKTKRRNLFDLERLKDYTLERDFIKIKKQRIKNQLEKEKEIERIKKLEKRGKTEFEKKKFADLAKKEISIPFAQRVKAKKRVEKIRTNTDYEDSVRKKRGNELRRKEKDENFLSYINKVKSTPSWHSSSDYVAKKEEKIEEIKEEQNKVEKLQSKKIWSIFNKNHQTKDESIPKENFKEEIRGPDEKILKPKLNLDDYLNKRIKKKKRNLFFAEKIVNDDLETRKD